MSSALVMVLMAAMAVPGNGPEKVSGEVEQRLVLSGEWEGAFYRHPDEKYIAHVCAGKVWLVHETYGLSPLADFHVIDEGRGEIRIQIGDKTCLGIYKWEGSHVLICNSYPGQERPASFEVNQRQELLILHRVKPGK